MLFHPFSFGILTHFLYISLFSLAYTEFCNYLLVILFFRRNSVLNIRYYEGKVVCKPVPGLYKNERT